MPGKRSPDQNIQIVNTRASASASADEIYQEMRIKMVGEMKQRVDGSEDGKRESARGDKS